MQDGEQDELAETVEGLLVGAQILVGEPRVLDDVGHGAFLRGFPANVRHRRRLRRQRGRAISGRMKSIVSALAALLLASSPVAGQTLEADMKKAAGAYEQKD